MPGFPTLDLADSMKQGRWVPEGFEWEVRIRLGLLGPHMLCLSTIPQVDAETVVGLARHLEPLEGIEESLDEALLRTVALSSAGNISPMAAILGGVAAQEVLKVDTGGEGGDCGSGQAGVCARGHSYPATAWSILPSQL